MSVVDQPLATVEPTTFSRPARYLNRMALFVVCVAAVAAVLSHGLVSAFMANPALNGVILGLLIVGIGFTFRSVLSLGPERDWLTWYQARLYHPRAHLPEPPQPSLLAPMVRMLGDKTGRLSLSAQSLRSLLDGIDARLSEGREISRYLIGLLIFLGLLGTFWGLLETIHAVADVINDLTVDQGDLALIFAELQAGLEAPLSGMGTAFSSSLFGLAGSLVLGFLELQSSQAQARFYNELEDWLSGNARLTSTTPTPDGESASNVYLRALLENVAETAVNLETLMGRAEESRRRTEGALQTLAEHLTTLTDRLQGLQTQLGRGAETDADLATAMGRLVHAAHDGAFGIDHQTRDHIRNLDARLSHLIEQSEKNRDLLVGEVRTEFKLLARTIAALAEEPAPRQTPEQ